MSLDMKLTLESQESDLNENKPETSGSLIFHIQTLRGNGDRELPCPQKFVPHLTCIMLLCESPEISCMRFCKMFRKDLLPRELLLFCLAGSEAFSKKLHA